MWQPAVVLAPPAPHCPQPSGSSSCHSFCAFVTKLQPKVKKKKKSRKQTRNSIKTSVVQDLQRLMHFRNSHASFDLGLTLSTTQLNVPSGLQFQYSPHRRINHGVGRVINANNDTIDWPITCASGWLWRYVPLARTPSPPPPVRNAHWPCARLAAGGAELSRAPNWGDQPACMSCLAKFTQLNAWNSFE